MFFPSHPGRSVFPTNARRRSRLQPMEDDFLRSVPAIATRQWFSGRLAIRSGISATECRTHSEAHHRHFHPCAISRVVQQTRMLIIRFTQSIGQLTWACPGLHLLRRPESDSTVSRIRSPGLRDEVTGVPPGLDFFSRQDLCWRMNARAGRRVG